MCGTGKDLLRRYVLLSLFLRTTSNLAARIPLPPPLGAPSPRERGYWGAAAPVQKGEFP